MEEKKDQIFRQKSLDKINSPEALDKYIKTTSPSIWVMLVAIIVFLVGVIIWSVVGKVESKKKIGCEIKNTYVTCALKESDVDNVLSESFILIDDEKIEIKSIEGPTNCENSDISSYVTFTGGIEDDEWFYLVKANSKLIDGNYDATIVFESISPITFIFNK